MVVMVLQLIHCPLSCRYVLKSQMKELLELEAKNAISIEEEIENERKKVDAKTPITEEVILQCNPPPKTPPPLSLSSIFA